MDEEFIATLIDANKRCRAAFTAMVDQYSAVVDYHAFLEDPDLPLNRAISKLDHSYKHVESVSNDMNDLMDLAKQLLALNNNAVGPTAADTVPAGPVVDNVSEKHNRDLPDLDPNKNA